MDDVAVDVLQARMAILERRIQFVTDELFGALARLEPVEADNAGDGDATPKIGGSVEFDADSLSQFAQGFYEREHDAAGLLFRWTGNGPFCELRFHLDRSVDRVFRMRVGTTPAEVVAKLSGYADYAPIPLEVEEQDGELIVTGLLPKRAYTRLAVVTFMLGKMTSKKKGKVTDSQWLGFRFYSFAAS